MTKFSNKPSLKTTFSLGVLTALSSPSLAQEAPVADSKAPLVTDRPDFTESAFTVGAGRVQIEAGATYERSGSARTLAIGEVLARVGVGKRAEIRVGVPSYLASRDGARISGLDDASLGAKFVLSANPQRPLALILGATLPTGSRRVAARKFQPEAVLTAGFDLSPKTGLGVNLGVGRPTDGSARFNQVFGSASLAFELSPKVGAFTEVFAFNRTEVSGRAQKFVDGGLTYALGDDLQLDGRIGFGLDNRVGGPDYFFGVGVSQRF